jgi:AraC-like DNA-binding protein
VGIVSRGKGASTTSLYAAYLHALGGTWLDKARRPAISGPQSLQALERLGRGVSLTTAAHAAGFADSAHFSRTFRAMLGIAPSALG